MIKVRVPSFPGMRPMNHNMDLIVLVDYRAKIKQIIRSRDVDMEFSFEEWLDKKALLCTEQRPPRRFVEVEPLVSVRDLGMMLLGGVMTFGCLVLVAFV